MNGVPLPVDAPSVADVLHDAGYRTALDRQAALRAVPRPVPALHRERASRRTARRRPTARTAASSTSSSRPTAPPGRCTTRAGCRPSTPRRSAVFYPVLDGDLQVNAAGGGDTGAPQVHVNPVPREWYHTDWVADRTIAWLDSLDADDDWFCWMSFPDPHHPWDPPQSEVGRIDWRDVPLPAGYPESAAEREAHPRRQAAPLAALVRRHARLELRGAAEWVPATLTADQVREVNARNAVECELIDEALGRVLAAIAGRGLGRRRRRRLHHRPRRAAGRLRPAVQGPVPRRRADAAAADLAAGAVGRRRRRPVVTRPVGLVDLAPDVLRDRRARRARVDAGRSRCRSTTPTPTTAASSGCSPSGTASCSASASTCARSPATAGCARRTGRAPCTTAPRASCTTSPTTRCSRRNRWDDPVARSLRDDLVADLWDSQPPAHEPRLQLEAPV